MVESAKKWWSQQNKVFGLKVPLGGKGESERRGFSCLYRTLLLFTSRFVWKIVYFSNVPNTSVIFHALFLNVKTVTGMSPHTSGIGQSDNCGARWVVIVGGCESRTQSTYQSLHKLILHHLEDAALGIVGSVFWVRWTR
jgi:hypothetical protein